ncbi:MAG: hypothetical protein MJ108_00300 [Saccharofermentans sp.]|nr:hypothetical protein [Saccharofermentans sp.]
MTKCNKVSKGNKRGAITVFLAIILSAIILIECTYVILVANLKQSLALRRAVELQVDSYLAQYDRQLLKTYGIYAFKVNSIDSNVFNEVMAANRLEDGQLLEICGMQTFDTNDLRRVISLYYAYRSSGVLLQVFEENIKSLLDELDSKVFKDYRKFMKSDAAKILMDVIDGAVSLTDTLEKAAENLNLDDIADSIGDFKRLIKQVDDGLTGNLVSGGGFDADNLGFCLDAYSYLSSSIDTSSGLIDDYLFHPCAVNYAAYNFDCQLEDDTALDGTSFDAFHKRNISDSEYILTGMKGVQARNATNTYIYMVLLLNEVYQIYNDDQLRAIIDGIATVLSIIVDVVSAGVIVLSPSVYVAAIIIIYAFISASTDLDNLLDGDTITVGNADGKAKVELGYRDFVSLFMFFVPDTYLLERMTSVINRDFDDYVIGVTMVGSCDSCGEYEVSRSYNIYE